MLTQTAAIVKGITRDSPALDPVDALASPLPQPVSPSTDYVIFIEFVDPYM
jgi:hypothetical protein